MGKDYGVETILDILDLVVGRGLTIDNYESVDRLLRRHGYPEGLKTLVVLAQPDTEEPSEPEELVCDECGREMIRNPDGTTNHLRNTVDDDNPDMIDYELDRDHVAFEAGDY